MPSRRIEFAIWTWSQSHERIATVVPPGLNKMARALTLNGEDWLADPNDWSHSVGVGSSTTVDFRRTDGSREVRGRVMGTPEDFAKVSEDELLAALKDALKS